MKKIIYLMLSFCLVLSSCDQENITNLNNDPKRASTVPSETLYANAQKNLFDQMVRHSVGSNMMKLWAQHWTETTYNDEANYDIIGRDPSNGFWNTLYTNVLQDLKSAREINDADMFISNGERNNKNAMIGVLEVMAFQVLVDLNGNIIYSEALQGSSNTTPAYDDDAAVYTDLLARLNAAIAMFNTNEPSYGAADFMYGGDITKWKKFANSVKLRLGMRLADVDSSTASMTVSQAVSAGVFTSNADNAQIPYEAAPPKNNPNHTNFVLNNRGSDIVAGKTIVDMMNTLDDPRRASFFDQNLGTDTYDGGPIGANNAYGNFTHINPAIVEDPTFPGTLLDYAQIEFLLAEAAERSFVGTPADAEAHYNAGITASFDFWGASDVANYLAKPEVAYTTAAGDWKQKIGTQKWIALYNDGFEAWCEYRRLDQPTLVLSELTQQTVPTRVFYPTNEAALNGSNYDAAVSAMGGDTLYEKIFWDVN